MKKNYFFSFFGDIKKIPINKPRKNSKPVSFCNCGISETDFLNALFSSSRRWFSSNNCCKTSSSFLEYRTLYTPKMLIVSSFHIMYLFLLLLLITTIAMIIKVAVTVYEVIKIALFLVISPIAVPIVAIYSMYLFFSNKGNFSFTILSKRFLIKNTL